MAVMPLSQSSSPVALANAKNVGGNRAASRTGNPASGAPKKPINRFRPMVEALFNEAGVAIDGHQPWDIAVHDDRFYQRLLTDGSLGMGESYMDGWWDSQRVDEMISRLLRAGLGEKIQPRKFFTETGAKQSRNHFVDA